VSFGYHNLVVDMRTFPILRSLGHPVVYDVTHSLQLPGAGNGVTAGQAEFIEPLASAGVAAGVDGVFMEVHERPEQAKSDAQNALRLSLLEPLLSPLVHPRHRARQPYDRHAVEIGLRTRRSRIEYHAILGRPIASTAISSSRPAPCDCRPRHRHGHGRVGLICRKIATTLSAPERPPGFASGRSHSRSWSNSKR
jgi:hypothetical protein